jgi:ABC-2 type transport system ATP-binding protein
VIEIKNLVKRYGDQLAVDHLNLTIEHGQVYGLLGLNGAGKTTTMNMITGYLAPTEGEIIVNGHNILDEAEEAKHCIGYLPDQPPLYQDMTVDEYLFFCAELKKLPKASRKAAIDEAEELTQLTEVTGRLIKNLSKGYRQRVGLAQAILGMPDIIILDEPTDGLDPKQINEILSLIHKLGEEHTVILSSHKLSEVQIACDHIVILHQGKKIADAPAKELEEQLNGAQRLGLTAKGSAQQVGELLTQLPQLEVLSLAEEDGESVAEVEYPAGCDLREDIFFLFADARVPLLRMAPDTASLEQVFMELTEEAEHDTDELEEGSEA